MLLEDSRYLMMGFSGKEWASGYGSFLEQRREATREARATDEEQGGCLQKWVILPAQH